PPLYASTRAALAALSSALIPAFSTLCSEVVVRAWPTQGPPVVTAAGKPVAVPPGQVVVTEFPKASLDGRQGTSVVQGPGPPVVTIFPELKKQPIALPIRNQS